MASTIEKKHNASKYSDLSPEEKAEMHRNYSRDIYNKMTSEEKKQLLDKRKGICEICKTNRVYVNLPEHKRSQAHKRKLEIMQQ